MSLKCLAGIALLALLTACKPSAPAEGTSAGSTQPATKPNPLAATIAAQAKMPKDWQGDWIGPEGTRMTLRATGPKVQVDFLTLDGPRQFYGEWRGDHIVIYRSAEPETIRRGDGKATGMKWLAEKRNCLVIRSGEGYCRD